MLPIIRYCYKKNNQLTEDLGILLTNSIFISKKKFNLCITKLNSTFVINVLLLNYHEQSYLQFLNDFRLYNYVLM